MGRHFNVGMSFDANDVVCGRAVRGAIRNINRFRPLERCTRIRLLLGPTGHNDKVAVGSQYGRSLLSHG